VNLRCELLSYQTSSCGCLKRLKCRSLLQQCSGYYSILTGWPGLFSIFRELLFFKIIKHQAVTSFPMYSAEAEARVMGWDVILSRRSGGSAAQNAHFVRLINPSFERLLPRHIFAETALVPSTTILLQHSVIIKSASSHQFWSSCLPLASRLVFSRGEPSLPHPGRYATYPATKFFARTRDSGSRLQFSFTANN
jgi:hypothetical protein